MKKEKIFVNKIDKRIDNNQNYCNVVDDKKNDSRVNNLTVDEKLKKLFDTNGYIFNVDVEIITNDKIYNTKIAGKVNNHIITLDNDIIDISSIKDIVF